MTLTEVSPAGITAGALITEAGPTGPFFYSEHTPEYIEALQCEINAGAALSRNLKVPLDERPKTSIPLERRVSELDVALRAGVLDNKCDLELLSSAHPVPDGLNQLASLAVVSVMEDSRAAFRLPAKKIRSVQVLSYFGRTTSSVCVNAKSNWDYDPRLRLFLNNEWILSWHDLLLQQVSVRLI